MLAKFKPTFYLTLYPVKNIFIRKNHKNKFRGFEYKQIRKTLSNK
ncbi:hypothetical protein PROVRUST_06341 [Providencia rustigianii DSM 4541]|uniref:Uncharacterized protein n=1 Tax=Providencia rustigianii DSM 4541 TaxID=500637 RepID=D1P2B7_9GAMM|nr:hypothetical protein PROVRUST_06341 [Providencia rustigianii DSM 4541]